MGVLFPLFILLACDTSLPENIARVKARLGITTVDLGSLPIFYTSTLATGLLVGRFTRLLALCRWIM